jgi:hypothetical protein
VRSQTGAHKAKPTSHLAIERKMVTASAAAGRFVNEGAAYAPGFHKAHIICRHSLSSYERSKVGLQLEPIHAWLAHQCAIDPDDCSKA